MRQTDRQTDRQTARRNEDGFPIKNEASPSGLPTQSTDVTSTQCLLLVLLDPDCAKLGRLHPSVSTYITCHIEANRHCVSPLGAKPCTSRYLQSVKPHICPETKVVLSCRLELTHRICSELDESSPQCPTFGVNFNIFLP
jgi:hypothetical protein